MRPALYLQLLASLASLSSVAPVAASSTGRGSHALSVKGVHKHIAGLFNRSAQPEPAAEPAIVVPKSKKSKNKKRNTKRCKKPKGTPASSPSPAAASSTGESKAPAPAANAGNDPNSGSETTSSHQAKATPHSNSGGGSRLDQIKNMYAFSGFVYAVDNCQSQSQAESDFKDMVNVGARTVITFGTCDQSGFYSNVIQAAEGAGIKIIPLVWTLLNSGESISSNVQPRINAIANAVIAHPDSVLAIAMGDEPLFDNDFGSEGSISSHISSLRSQLQGAGLDVPISLSDMAFGWQQLSKGDQQKMADSVDFMMINTFPYFAGNAGFGGADSSFTNFKNDLNYFMGIAGGKPLLVTQTGWPSNKDEFSPNSGAVQATTSSEQAFFNLLDSHCSDYFKANNIGWMWRDWDDGIQGWGVKGSNGQFKFDVNAKTSC